MSIKKAIKKALPPFVIEKVKSYWGTQSEESGEKSANWYDKAFEESDIYDTHYTKSPFYPIWTVLIDRFRKHGPANVLEIGCGSGQLACALKDYGLLNDYCGLDFSPKRIEFARSQCPELRFEIADVFKTDLMTTVDYDMVITTEFLEHVEKDLEVIALIRSDVHFLGSVPNFPWTSHVRHFDTSDQVIERYSAFFGSFDVFPISWKKKNKVIYVMEGH